MCVAIALATLKFNQGAASWCNYFLENPSGRQNVKAVARDRRRVVAGSAEKVKQKSERKYAKRRKTTGEEGSGAGIEDRAGNM